MSVSGTGSCRAFVSVATIESFGDCFFGFVLSRPQKGNACVGFVVDGKLFRALVSF
jgi:hypothetical protein